VKNNIGMRQLMERRAVFALVILSGEVGFDANRRQ